MPDFEAIRARLSTCHFQTESRRDGESNDAYRRRTRHNSTSLRNWHRVHQSNLCHYCKVWMLHRPKSHLWDKQITLEHLDSLERGGLQSVENTVAACLACNIAKKNMTVEEYLANWEELRAAIVKKLNARRQKKNLSNLLSRDIQIA